MIGLKLMCSHPETDTEDYQEYEMIPDDLLEHYNEIVFKCPECGHEVALEFIFPGPRVGSADK